MEFRSLGDSGTYVSELCLGTMTFGDGADIEASRSIVDTYLDRGGNFIDTANRYADGVAEEFLGQLLGSHRAEVVLATKGFGVDRLGVNVNDRGNSRKNLIRSLEASLRRLRTDYVDLYQLHCWDNFTPLHETLEALDLLVRSGKVRYIGASNFQGWQLAKAAEMQRANGWARFVTIQPQFSLMVRDAELEIIPAALDAGLGIVAWSPLGGGLLSGKYHRDAIPAGARYSLANPDEDGRLTDNRNPVWDVIAVVEDIAGESGHTVPQVALNWVLNRRGVTAPIVGARTVQQLEDNLGATGWSLDDDQLARLDQVSPPPSDYASAFVAESNMDPSRRGQGADE